MRTPLFAVVAGLLVVPPLVAQPDEKVVPVHEEPRHRVVFERPGTRILDIQIPPGDTTLFHTHSEPILYVPMSASQTRSQTLGREWSGGGNAPATPTAPAAPDARRRPVNSVTSYAKQPLTHRVNNIGQTLFRLIGVTNASAGDPSTTPSADFSEKPELDNAWFRVYRHTLSPTPIADHRHAHPVAIVVIDGQVSGVSVVPLPPRGGYVFLEANTTHTLRAVDGSAEIVEIEIRRPR
jgi:quercetin dioxygenase-like cupin family protein